jgi:molybdopterin molybdotransferase
MDIPPFDKSAMDGFACRKKDLGNELTIVETIYAGKEPDQRIGANECAKIMTGAVVPPGADMIFIKEVAELIGEDKVVCKNLEIQENICYTGEDVRKGELALPKGSLITSRNIPVLAGAGADRFKVYRQPVVAVFSTGTELVEPGAKPLSFQIRNSNSYQMLAQLGDMGIEAEYRGIIKDDEVETEQKIAAAMKTSDLILLSGGVSMGDSDFIPEIIKKLGFEIIVTESAIQPGKPIIFARKENKFCFGLAGNPVSSWVQIEIYVKHFIYRIMGYESTHVTISAVMGEEYSRKKTERLKFLPATLDGSNIATPVEFHGSAHIDAFSRVNCLIDVPIGISEIKKGEIINVRPV